MKQHRPTTPGRRGMTRADFTMIDKNKPEKGLLGVLRKTGGRSRGIISTRHRGGGAKRRYRIIEFSNKIRSKVAQAANNGVMRARVLAIEYDPNRSARIALVQYGNSNKKAYVIAPEGLRSGDEIIFAEDAALKRGNRMKLANIPVGTFVYDVAFSLDGKGRIARSAGTSCKVLAAEGKYTTITMPSGERRKVLSSAYASIGSASNAQHRFRVMGKAGITRKLGRRPRVRGSAMNPVDHPHGGGEGRSPIGLKRPKTPWGKAALGVRSRKKRKYSDKLILRRRKIKRR